MKKYIIILILLHICFNSLMHARDMIIHEYCSELFLKERITTEYVAYQLLKQTPIKKPINCLIIPWVNLIKKKHLDLAPDIKLEGGFTICQHVKYKDILPILKKIGIDVLFTPHARPNEKYKGIKILPFPHYPVHGIDPAPTKDIYYSFVGYSTHKVRRKIFKMQHPKNCVIIKRDTWHWWNTTEIQEKEKKEYQDVLARSRFSLCPSGVGPSTPRFWESLQAGAIPVIIADKFSLPDWIDWTTCCIKIPENEVDTIAEVLAQITPEQEACMQKKCIEVFKLFSQEDFVSTIRHYYDDASF